MESTPVKIPLDVLNNFVDKSQPYELHVTGLFAKYLCNRMDTFTAVGAIDRRIARLVHELKNILISADSTRGRTPPAVDFGS